MTVSNSNNRTRLAVSGLIYDFTFAIDADTEILVYEITDGVAVLLTLTTDYTVSISTLTEGGTVTLNSLSGADEILMVRAKPYVQSADIPVRGGFNEAVIEGALDNLEMQIQQLKELIDYCVKQDSTTVPIPVIIPTPVDGNALVWDGVDGTITNVPFDATTIANSVISAEAAAVAAEAAAVTAEASVGTIVYYWGGSAGGTADTLTLTPTPAISSYAAGERFAFLATATNTGAATVNISGLGAKTIKTQQGAALTAGDITSGNTYSITYDGTDFRIHENPKVLPVANGGTGVSTLAALMGLIYPIGSVVTLGVSTNPATLYGVGTWTAIEGRVIVGKAAAGTFGTLDATMGSETHTLDISEIPAHTHSYSSTSDLQQRGDISSVDVPRTPTTGTTGSTGGGGAHNNIQPTIVKYVWQRTA